MLCMNILTDEGLVSEVCRTQWSKKRYTHTHTKKTSTTKNKLSTETQMNHRFCEHSEVKEKGKKQFITMLLQPKLEMLRKPLCCNPT